MPRFVILLHQMPAGTERAGTHWDLMLERDGVLHTWALPLEPRPEGTVETVRLADHRIDYLEYEGPVSGNRGEVRRWDEGTYQIVQESADAIALNLAGGRLTGRVDLTRTSYDRAEFPQRWTFSLSPAD